MPVTIEIEDAIIALKHGQTVPAALWAKQKLSGEKGDGVNKESEQGKELFGKKFKESIRVFSGHDIGANSGYGNKENPESKNTRKLGASETIAKELLEKCK